MEANEALPNQIKRMEEEIEKHIKINHINSNPMPTNFFCPAPETVHAIGTIATRRKPPRHCIPQRPGGQSAMVHICHCREGYKLNTISHRRLSEGSPTTRKAGSPVFMRAYEDRDANLSAHKYEWIKRYTVSNPRWELAKNSPVPKQVLPSSNCLGRTKRVKRPDERLVLRSVVLSSSQSLQLWCSILPLKLWTVPSAFA